MSKNWFSQFLLNKHFKVIDLINFPSLMYIVEINGLPFFPSLNHQLKILRVCGDVPTFCRRMVLHNHVKNKIRYELFFLFLLDSSSPHIICVWVEMNVWGVQSHLSPLSFDSFCNYGYMTL